MECGRFFGHTWSNWSKPYEESGSLRIANGNIVPYVEVRQYRTCEVCNKHEDRMVKSGSLSSKVA